MFIGLIPMYYGSIENDIAFYSGTAVVTLGCLTSIIGYCGYTSQIGKIKINKKEFIYYLKASHNGLGIVTVF